MPFTPSHIAAVLPLRGRLGTGLPLAALAAGSMSPDLPYYLPLPDWRVLAPATHSLVGIATWDLLFGVILWVAWRAAAATVHDLAPEVIRSRWRPVSWPAAPTGLLLVAAAVLVGSGSHVLWDEFTHAGRFGTTYVQWIAAAHAGPWGSLPGYRLLQYGSGVFGLAVLAWEGLRRPRLATDPRRHPGLAGAATWVVTAGALAAIGLRLASVDQPADPRTLAFATATAGISGGAATAVGLCLAHALLPSRARSAEAVLRRGWGRRT